MRGFALFRIIAFAFVAVILFGILITSLIGVNIFRNFSLSPILSFSPGWGVLYSSNEIYESGPSSVSGDNIARIKVDWVAGSIDIRPGTGSKITFSESSSGSLSEREKLHWRVSGDTLIIQYCDSGFNIGRLSLLSKGKALTIELPEDIYLKLLDIDSVSSSLTIDRLNGTELNISQVSGRISLRDGDISEARIEGVSGRVDISDVSIGRLDLNTVSGSVDMTGSFERMDVEGVSARITARTSVLPSEMRVETVSGRIDMTIPENDGFTVKLDSVSGKLNCDFPMIVNSGTQTYKSGGPSYRFESISGSVSIHKG